MWFNCWVIIFVSVSTGSDVSVGRDGLWPDPVCWPHLWCVQSRLVILFSSVDYVKKTWQFSIRFAARQDATASWQGRVRGLTPPDTLTPPLAPAHVISAPPSPSQPPARIISLLTFMSLIDLKIQLISPTFGLRCTGFRLQLWQVQRPATFPSNPAPDKFLARFLDLTRFHFLP